MAIACRRSTGRNRPADNEGRETMTTAARGGHISSAADLLAQARALVPELKARRAEAETLRRVPPASIDALKNAGLFRIFVPHEYGGYQLSLREGFDIYAEIGRGCGSTAWVTMILATINLVMGRMPDRAQEDLFGANPDTRVAGVFVPRGTARPVDGGYLLSGSWPFCSGCHYGDWFSFLAAIKGDDGAVVDEIVLLVRAKEAEILDDWHVVGLRGSGSNSVTVKDVFVPQHRTVGAAQFLGVDPPSSRAKTTPVYRSAMSPLLTLVLAAPALGLARSALEDFQERIPGRSIPYTFYGKQSEAAVTHLRAGEAALKIDAAGALARAVADEVDDAARRDAPVSVQDRMRLRAQSAYVSRLSLEAAETLYLAAGGSAISEKSALQRICRDLHAANLHGLACFDTNVETYGRVLLGLEPNTYMV
jgi:alkylation response protein AidB-like acyl-CoA dehydrogenase